jgi:hypothetical protein
VAIAVFLADEGFTGSAAVRARAILEAAQLTRPGKVRLSKGKLPRARKLLSERLVRSCQRSTCLAANDRRETVHVRSTECEICGGSANRRAGELAREAMLLAGCCRLLVVGGTRTTQADLIESLGADIEVRWIDGQQAARAAPTVEADLAWADVLVVWASTPLPHKVSLPYTSRARGRLPWITVARRSVAAVCTELVRLCGGLL